MSKPKSASSWTECSRCFPAADQIPEPGDQPTHGPLEAPGRLGQGESHLHVYDPSMKVPSGRCSSGAVASFVSNIFLSIVQLVFYGCDKDRNQKQLGMKGFTWLPSQSLREDKAELKRSGNLEAGTEVKTMEERCLLACSPWLSQPSFLYHPGPPVQGWHHPQWPGPSHINQENAPQICQSDGGNVSVEAPRLTKKPSVH